MKLRFRAFERLREGLGVEKGETPLIFWLSVLSLSNGVFIAFFFSTAYSLFLAEFDAEQLPWAYIASSIFGSLLVARFAKMERRLAFKGLLLLDYGFLVALVVAFWLALGAAGVSPAGRWLAFALFITVEPALALLELGFWGLAVRIFDLRQGKRLFGLIGTGGVVSSIVGFFLVPVLVQYLDGPVQLLLIAAGGVGISIVVALSILQRFGGRMATEKPSEAAAERGFRELLGDRYFRLLAAMAALFVLCYYLVDLSFLSQIEQRFASDEQVASFLGVFFGATKLIELITKTAVSGRVISQFGLKAAHLLLPATVLAFASLTVLVGGFPVFGSTVGFFFPLVAFTKMMWQVLKKAIYESSIKVLYQPLPRSDRLAFQTHVEGTVSQLSTLGVGIFLLVVSGASALTLLTVALPCLVAWIAMVLLIHREYRARLLRALSTAVGRAMAVAPAEALKRYLRRSPPAELSDGVRLLAQVSAPSVVPLLEEMAEEGKDEQRIAALGLIRRIHAVGARPTVARLAGSPADPEPVRQAFAEALAGLEEVERLAADPERLGRLVASGDPADRDLAATALGFATGPQVRDQLSALLSDGDWTVRRAALVAAGRCGLPELWPRLLSALETPVFANAATFALITIGEAVLPELERLFSKSGMSDDVRARILRIYEHVRSPRAHALLLAKLKSPSPQVRSKALVSLSLSRFQAEGEQVAEVHGEIAELVESMGWIFGALLDLDKFSAETPVRAALEGEIEQKRRRLLLLLSLLYDPQALGLAKENLERHSSEATVYALEILDVLVEPAVKPLIFPVLESLTPAQRVRRLRSFFYLPRMERAERLSAIAHRPPALISTRPKASALHALGQVDAEKALVDLVANLFHPEKVLREVAALNLHARRPELYRHKLKSLPEYCRDLDWVLGLDGGEDLDAEAAGRVWRRRAIASRARLLRRVGPLGDLPWDALVKMGELVETRDLEPGEEPWEAGSPERCLGVVVDGQVVSAAKGEPRSLWGEGSVLVAGPLEPRLEAVEATRLLVLGGEALFEMMADHGELVPVVLGGTGARERAATPRVTGEMTVGGVL